MLDYENTDWEQFKTRLTEKLATDVLDDDVDIRSTHVQEVCKWACKNHIHRKVVELQNGNEWVEQRAEQAEKGNKRGPEYLVSYKRGNR